MNENSNVGDFSATAMNSSKSESIFNKRKLCLTGFSYAEEKYAGEMIQKLDGRFSRDLSRDSFCVIVMKVGSQKYETAIKLGIPTVTIQWLKDCLKGYILLPFDLYKPPCFLGLIISCSQLQPKDRSDLQLSIEVNGGTYSAALEIDKTTHLVALKPEGEKYLFAKSWNTVKIVNPEWISTCVERQCTV